MYLIGSITLQYGLSAGKLKMGVNLAYVAE